MNLKLNFLLPDIKSANRASESLLLAKVDNKNICFLAKPGTDIGDLLPASTFEKTNIINVGVRGIFIGATIGLLIGLYMHYYQPWITSSMNVSWLTILAITTLFGALVSTIGGVLFGVGIFNTDLDKFKDKIDKGAILMIVSVPIYRSKEVSNIVKNLHLQF
jgi:hypothetical protein